MSAALVTAHHYILNLTDDFSGMIVTDAHTGLQRAYGTDYGQKLALPLEGIAVGVPLCMGCDKPVPPDGVCHGCEMVHADLVQMTEAHGDPFLKRRVA